MKNAWFAAGILIFTLFAAAAACAGQSISSEITDVTLFFDKARVSRQASASVAPGSHSLVIPLDAFSIEEKSVTAEVAGQGEILGVRMTKVPTRQSPQEKIRELQTRLRELQDQKQEIRDRKTALERQEKFLDGVVDFSGTQVPKEIKTQMPAPGDLDATLDFLGKRFAKIFDEKRIAENKLVDLKKEIDQVRRELDMLRGRADKTDIGIEILFRTEKAQELAITAGYTVHNAGWSPVYRAVARDAASDVDLSMMGQIRQKTGEDWENVNLSVSTAPPVHGGRLPELAPWHIDTPQPRARKSGADGAAAMKELAARPPAKKSAPMAEAKRRRTPISFEYDLPEPVSVASREEKTLLPLFTKSIAGEFYHYAAPRRDPRAYLVYSAKTDSELLAGPVNIFFADRYVGEMFLAEKQAGEAFVLGLGADRAVAIKHEKVRDHRKETAFFGQIERDAIVREIKYRITAENLRDREIKLRVTDHIPVSKTDRIKVEDVTFSPGPEKRDVEGKPGVMQWRFALTPGQTEKISISFTVAYPKDMPAPVF
ncbi:MAG: mucoidy inhibitor MuiA family protein [Desulfobacteraceae bacterium]|nr:mucoidy inhibitor MuiA family protein [Desulfobacteraceae bacterium]